jgi:hypothetical protein
MLGAIDTAYTVMKHTGDVKQAGKAMMDELNTLHRMSQGQQGVAEASISTQVSLPKWKIGLPVFVKHLGQKGKIASLGNDSAIVDVGMRQYRVPLDGLKRYPSQGVAEEWSQKYKKSINCSHPKGFSQKAHCAGKKKHNESIEMEMTCPDCGMCETHGDHSRNTLDEACWKGYHKEGNKKMFGKTYPNCVKNTNEEQELDENLHKWFKEKWVRFGPDGKIRGDCARGDDSEGKPKCLPQNKAHSLGKKGRASAAARKRREDPNPERSGKAINVNTKKKSNEDITEISDVTKQSYKQQAQQQVKDLKPHAEKGEYKDIAQRAIDRRERGLKRLGK